MVVGMVAGKVAGKGVEEKSCSSWFPLVKLNHQIALLQRSP